jgi:hypothetical protein
MFVYNASLLTADSVMPFDSWLSVSRREVSSCVLRETQLGLLKFAVPQRGISVAYVFCHEMFAKREIAKHVFIPIGAERQT